MFRVHQFNKVEQFVFIGPRTRGRARTVAANTEALVAEFMLYRVVVLATGDMSKVSAKTYDVELWFLAAGWRYRETASITNATDYGLALHALPRRRRSRARPC